MKSTSLFTFAGVSQLLSSVISFDQHVRGNITGVRDSFRKEQTNERI